MSAEIIDLARARRRFRPSRIDFPRVIDACALFWLFGLLALCIFTLPLPGGP